MVAVAVLLSVAIIEGSTARPQYDDYNDYDPYDVPPDQAAPSQGYNYPVPANPLTLPPPPPQTTPAPTPAQPAGYSYPVPQNPLELPERTRSGKLVREERPLLIIGLKHTEFDSYDPG